LDETLLPHCSSGYSFSANVEDRWLSRLKGKASRKHATKHSLKLNRSLVQFHLPNSKGTAYDGTYSGVSRDSSGSGPNCGVFAAAGSAGLFAASKRGARMKCCFVTIRIDGLDEGVDLLPVGAPERPTSVLVLGGIHSVMCASTHAHR